MAILVMNANTKGAFGAGHVALVTSASYNSRTKVWTINVQDANWGDCGVRNHTFAWGDLNGVNFYVH